MIQVSAYKKAYGPHVILEIDKMQFDKGIHWILGKNGSGKSTLFKSILGIVSFDGSIQIEGLGNNSRAAKRLLGFSEAEPQFPSAVSGFDILYYMAEVKNASVDELTLLAQKWGVDIYWKNAISSYSSGMLKKISLLSAFLGKPKWIILDEPFILIDAQTLTYLQDLIIYYAKTYNTSFLISSHQVFDLNASLPIHTHLIENAIISRL